MTSLTCPACGSALDLFAGVVSRQRTYPLTLLRDETVLVVDRVEHTAQVVTCSGCEFASTVKDVLAGKVAL